MKNFLRQISRQFFQHIRARLPVYPAACFVLCTAFCAGFHTALLTDAGAGAMLAQGRLAGNELWASILLQQLGAALLLAVGGLFLPGMLIIAAVLFFRGFAIGFSAAYVKNVWGAGKMAAFLLLACPYRVLYLLAALWLTGLAVQNLREHRGMRQQAALWLPVFGQQAYLRSCVPPMLLCLVGACIELMLSGGMRALFPI